MTVIMSENIELASVPAHTGVKGEVTEDKTSPEEQIDDAKTDVGADLNATEDDLLEAKEIAATFSLVDVRDVRCHFSPNDSIPLSIIQ